ncbi:hypothetical protein KKE68_05365 [Patescibacteria group bacterium]|nr:hypothetical protein [Patescibacteria group bacterium]
MEDLLKKIEEFKNKKGADLSMEEDLSIAIMNLISLEEHFYFTGQKTKKDKYFQYVEQIREIRKRMLAKMIPQNEGETWCISKHLLAAAMRLIEVGTKYQTMKKPEKAKEVFDDAYALYNLFFAIRLKLVDLGDLKNKKEKAWSEDDIVAKLVDCCRE